MTASLEARNAEQALLQRMRFLFLLKSDGISNRRHRLHCNHLARVSLILHSGAFTKAGLVNASFILPLCGPRNKLGTVQLPWQKILRGGRDLTLNLGNGGWAGQESV